VVTWLLAKDQSFMRICFTKMPNKAKAVRISIIKPVGKSGILRPIQLITKDTTKIRSTPNDPSKMVNITTGTAQIRIESTTPIFSPNNPISIEAKRLAVTGNHLPRASNF
jgi:hypothetical protein